MSQAQGHGGERGWLASLKHSMKAGFPAALFLTSLVTLFSDRNWFRSFEPIAMRAIYTFEDWGPRWLGLQLVSREYPRVPSHEALSVLQLSSKSFENDFRRISPTPRGCIGKALLLLAERFKHSRPPGGFPVLAIDIDVTIAPGELLPAEGKAAADAPCHEAPWLIGQGLEALSEHATVIALALDRRTPGERSGRNEFIKTHCSPAFAANQGGIYFASAAAFTRGVEPVVAAPGPRKPTGETSVGRAAMPAIYPSLGNLMAIAHRAHSHQAFSAADHDAMTGLCKQAKQTPKPALIDLWLVDDVVLGSANGKTADDVAAQYEFNHLNLLAAQIRVQTSPIDSIDELAFAPIKSPTIMLALSDGSTADRFITAKDSEDFTEGSWLQAATALTLNNRLRLAAKAAKYAADLAAGLLFAALVTPLHVFRARRTLRWPFAQRSGLLLLPLLAAATVLGIGFVLSAHLLHYAVWFNPIYMVAGMLMHTYFEAAAAPYHERSPPVEVTTGRSSLLDRVTTSISDWTDVDSPPPHYERSKHDRAVSLAWAAVFAAMVLWAAWLVFYELAVVLFKLLVPSNS